MASTALSPLPLKDIADGPYHNPGDYIFSPLGLSLVSPTFQPRPYLDDFALKDGALCLDNWLQETSEGDNHSKQGTMDLLNAFDAASTREAAGAETDLPDLDFKASTSTKPTSASKKRGFSMLGEEELAYGICRSSSSVLLSLTPLGERRPKRAATEHYTQLRAKERAVQEMQQCVAEMESAMLEAERKVAASVSENGDLWATVATLRLCLMAGAESVSRHPVAPMPPPRPAAPALPALRVEEAEVPADLLGSLFSPGTPADGLAVPCDMFVSPSKLFGSFGPGDLSAFGTGPAAAPLLEDASRPRKLFCNELNLICTPPTMRKGGMPLPELDDELFSGLFML